MREGKQGGLCGEGEQNMNGRRWREGFRRLGSKWRMKRVGRT